MWYTSQFNAYCYRVSKFASVFNLTIQYLILKIKNINKYVNIKNIYIINKLIIIIILFRLKNFYLNKVLLESILHNFILFLSKDMSDLNYNLVMMNEDGNNKKVDSTSFPENIESNINNESKRVERIENWFNKGWLDDKRKEELINSGKDFNEKELNGWLMEQDRQEYFLNKLKEEENKKKIYEWLNNVEEPTSLPTNDDLKPNSKPSSQWSPSGSEQGSTSISNDVNSNMDQIKDYINSFESFYNDVDYLIIPEYFIIYICYFIIIICFCFLIIYSIGKK